MQLEKFELLFDTLSNAAENVYIFENDMENNYSKWSNNAVEYFALPEDYHINILNVWLQRIHEDDRRAYTNEINAIFSGEKAKHRSQYRVKNRYGDYVWVECNGNVARDNGGKLKLFAGIITRLDNQSKYDPLTKKLAIHQFYLNNELSEASTVLLFGMDKFRTVIHRYGYETGNELLIALADELDRPEFNHRVYRMNGDEFLVVLPAISEESSKKYFQEVLNGYSGSVVKKKIQDFYNELILWISDKEHGEDSGTLPRSIYALSYIWQEHRRIVAFSWCLVIKCRMTFSFTKSIYC